MYMERNKKFIEMMNGGFGEFTQCELWAILTNQNELGINTIMVQKLNENEFICQVDDLTVTYYLDQLEGKRKNALCLE